MPIPDADRAIVTPDKVRNYLLNPDHPDGGSKAVWFASVGYSPDDCEQLIADLLAIARSCAWFDTERSQFGVKYKASGELGRLGVRPGRVLTVWIVEGDDPPRLVTAYPDSKS